MRGVRAFLELSGARLPLIQAPMAGFAGPDLAIAAIGAGAVGSLACATLSPEAVVEAVATIRAGARGPLNLNVFCHRLGPLPDTAAWEAQLAPCYAAEDLSRPTATPPLRRPFDDAMAEAIETARPEFVSFHFGLPEAPLLARMRATGAGLIGNATTVAEARFLAEQGCDAIIAQGFEAGGHAGHFLGRHQPVGLFALVPEIADAVDVPVIAAGGIADERGVRAAIALGAAAVQVGTAYLRTPESLAGAPHHAALAGAGADDSVFTNLFSGGLARGLRNRLIAAIGPVSAAAPPFPYASTAVAPLRAHAESEGRGDYSPLWAGQGVARARAEPAAALTRQLGEAALATMEPA